MLSLKNLLLAIPVLAVPLTLQAAPEDAEFFGDGDVGYEVSPEPVLTHPVAIALDQAPLCETPPEWSEVMSGIPASELRAAIEEGVLTERDLPRAIAALREVGTADDLAALWNDADTVAWTYVSDILGSDAAPEDVFAAQEALHGSIRRTVLSEWGARGDLPALVLLSALDDPDPRVRRNATRLAFASGEETLVGAAVAVRGADPAVADVSYICP